MDILVISLCLTLSAGEDFVDMEDFCNDRIEWLKGFLELPNGIPDSDTFRRMFERAKAMATDTFTATVRQYTLARKLTSRMLNELVDFIEVYHAINIEGIWEQNLRIHFNCVGAIEIPEVLALPQPDILIKTGRGVFVSYAPATVSI